MAVFCAAAGAARRRVAARQPAPLQLTVRVAVGAGSAGTAEMGAVREGLEEAEERRHTSTAE